MIPYSARIRARLRALLAKHETTARALSLKLGRSNFFINTKIRPNPSKGLTVADIDLILGALGEGPEVLESPVLARGDLEILAACAKIHSMTREKLAKTWPLFSAALRRLLDQGLVVESAEGVLRTSPEGARLRARLVAPE